MKIEDRDTRNAGAAVALAKLLRSSSVAPMLWEGMQTLYWGLLTDNGHTDAVKLLKSFNGEVGVLIETLNEEDRQRPKPKPNTEIPF